MSNFKIKINWTASSNCTFRGSDEFEIDKEEWESMDDDEKAETAHTYVMMSSGFDWSYDDEQ